MSWNCDGDTNRNLEFPWAPELRICPNAYITDDIWAQVKWWVDWKTFRVLPYAGGGDLLDQPAFVVDVIRRCEETVATIDSERADKARAEAKKRQEQLEEERRQAARKARYR